METARTPAARRPPGAPRPPVSQPSLRGRFAALDFETADTGRDSACAQILIKAREKGHRYEELLQKHALKPAKTLR